MYSITSRPLRGDLGQKPRKPSATPWGEGVIVAGGSIAAPAAPAHVRDFADLGFGLTGPHGECPVGQVIPTDQIFCVLPLPFPPPGEAAPVRTESCSMFWGNPGTIFPAAAGWAHSPWSLILFQQLPVSVPLLWLTEQTPDAGRLGPSGLGFFFLQTLSFAPQPDVVWVGRPAKRIYGRVAAS